MRTSCWIVVACLGSIVVPGCAAILEIEEGTPLGEGGAGGAAASGSGGPTGGDTPSSGEGGGRSGPVGSGGSGDASSASSTNGPGSGGSGSTAASGPDCNPACTGDAVCCGGVCTDVSIDEQNCGACGVQCATADGEVCTTRADPRCADIEWALWRMPNGANEIAAGAPTNSAPGYTDHGDGTVSAGLTGMMWQKTEEATTMTWDQADEYCASTLSGQGLGGHDDWRLPTRIELMSLVDLDVATPGPTLSSALFPEALAEVFWTRTPYPQSESRVWTVNFSYGGSVPVDRTDTFFVRCVR